MDSLVLGMRTLTYSASFFEEEEEEILTEEAPFIPTATSGWKLVANEQNWTGYPTVEGGFDYAPNAPMPADGILTLMNLRPKG